MNAVHTFTTRFATAFALLQRDCKVLRGKLRGLMIDSAMLLIVEFILFTKLFPLMGMPQSFIMPMYIGAAVFIAFMLAYNYGYALCFDKEATKFIEYHLTLPLPKRWLFAEYITYYSLELFITTFPLFMIGMLLLYNDVSFAHANFFYFFVSYLLMIIFLVSFFVMWAFCVSFDLFSDHLWSLVLEPVLILSALYVTWKATYAFAPRIAIVLLFNPMTYVAEALRSSLLGSTEYISAPLCMFLVFVSCFGLWFFTGVGVKRSLDPI